MYLFVAAVGQAEKEATSSLGVCQWIECYALAVGYNSFISISPNLANVIN